MGSPPFICTVFPYAVRRGIINLCFGSIFGNMGKFTAVVTSDYAKKTVDYCFTHMVLVSVPSLPQQLLLPVQELHNVSLRVIRSSIVSKTSEESELPIIVLNSQRSNHSRVTISEDRSSMLFGCFGVYGQLLSSLKNQYFEPSAVSDQCGYTVSWCR